MVPYVEGTTGVQVWKGESPEVSACSPATKGGGPWLPPFPSLQALSQVVSGVVTFVTLRGAGGGQDQLIKVPTVSLVHLYPRAGAGHAELPRVVPLKPCPP